MILVTGASGLIGRFLCARLVREGMACRPFDLHRSRDDDIRCPGAFETALDGVTGVVHLAAVSRVLWGERDPETCWQTNVLPLEWLARILAGRRDIFVVFASSREVYGQADRLPVAEDAPLAPLNVYARSKVAGEAAMEALRADGVVANVCRFSSVFGCPGDHADRVAMAFATAAAHGGVIRMEGRDNLFDFTAVEDAADGLFRLVEASARGERLPPIHFVSGRGTTLAELAGIASHFAGGDLSIADAPPRKFDVSRFVGDPSRARALLGWEAQAGLEERVGRLVRDLRAGGPPGTAPAGAPTGPRIAAHPTRTAP